MVRQSTDSILSEKIFNTLKDISEQNKHSSTSNICGGRIQKTSIASQDKFKGPVFDTPYNPNETFNRHESERKLGQIKLVDDRNDIKDDSGELHIVVAGGNFGRTVEVLNVNSMKSWTFGKTKICSIRAQAF